MGGGNVPLNSHQVNGLSGARHNGKGKKEPLLEERSIDSSNKGALK